MRTGTALLNIMSTRHWYQLHTASFIHQSADGTLTIDGEAIIDLKELKMALDETGRYKSWW